MRIIGLTGPTGAGKSTFCKYAAELGYAVIDCDHTAKSVTEKGSPVLNKLCEAFCGGIINSDGTLNRKKLAMIAFSSKENTEKLNKIIFPPILEKINEQIFIAKKNGAQVCILDAPTLFESGADSMCDMTVGIISGIEQRRARIIERDGLSDAEADVRLKAQKPDMFYEKKCDLILKNHGNINEFEGICRKILTDLRR